MAYEKAIVMITEVLSRFMTKIIVAVIILLIGFIIGRIIGKLTQKFLQEIELNNIMKKAAGIKISLEKVISNFIAYFIYFITIIMALNQLGLTTTVLYMISGAVIILIILSIFLAIKDFIPNLISGIIIHKKQSVKKGDFIKLDDIEGKVIYMDLIKTRIETKSKDIIHIPNSNITKKKVIVKKRS